MACDIHFKKVSLLLDFDGTNGSTSFADMSSANTVVVAQNGAAVSTTAPKFGTGCLPTTTGYLSAASSAGGPIDISTGDWTVEFWVKVNTVGTVGIVVPILCFGAVSAVDGITQVTGFRIGTYNNGPNGMAVFLAQTVGLPLDYTYGGNVPADGNWHAIAVERYGQQIAVYVDGTILTTGPLDAGSNFTAYTQLLIGRDNLGSTFDGEIDELRITKGYARYRTTSYTPSTSAFGVACVGEQPVVPVMEDSSYPGYWASLMFPVAGFPNYIYTYDPPTYQDPDTNVAVLFALSYVSGSSTESIVASDVVATYGGIACQTFVQNINPANGTYITQRCTVLMLCILPVGSTFSSNELHVHFTTAITPSSILAQLGATALLVDPAYVLAVPESATDFATQTPFSFIIPSYTAPINHLMVSVFNCAVSSPGTPDVVSSPAFFVGSDIGSAVPMGMGERQLLSGSESNAVSWNYTPTPITVGSGQFFWGNTFSLPPAPFGEVVPSVIGDIPADADAEITGAGFVVGSVTFAPSNAAPAGTVFFQNPAGGFLADPGSTVDYIVSTGPSAAFVPNVVGETVDQANSDITGSGFQVGNTATQHSDTVPAGVVISQQPPGGTQAALGTFVSYIISSGPTPPPPPATGTKFDFEATVISQYANSPTLLQLCSNMNDYVDQSTNFATFFDFVWNVNTAQGFGLDIWGKIVNISRLLTIPNTSRNFGFQDNITPSDYDPFNVSPFNSKGGGATQTYLLNDAAYRTLILTKALSNISATTAPSLNQLLRNLFPGRGRCYVLDLGGMAMQFTFEFQLTVTEFAILAQSKALPRPAGVAVNIVTLSGGSVLGFEEAGGSAESFGFGHFY